MTDGGRLAERIEEIRASHAPDPRTAVWEVTLEDDDPTRVAGSTDVLDAIPALREAAQAAAAVFAVERLPDESAGEAIGAIAHRSLAHLRSEPRHGAELVHQMILGEEAFVLRSRGEWLQVRTADPYVAWVHEGSLVRRTPPDAEAFRERLRARRPPDEAWIVAARGVVAREGPEPGSAPACDLVEGAIVRRAGSDRPEARAIELPDGLVGWVDPDAVVPAARLGERFRPDPRAVIDHAARFLGLPYLWGGASEKGFDCSGFVQRIASLHGVHLPRDSDQQARVGRPVDPGAGWKGVEDGDLAFFSERNDGRVTHVGFLAAGGRLLHASTTRNGVAWDPLAEAGRSPFGDRLAAWLTGVRRLAFPRSG